MGVDHIDFMNLLKGKRIKLTLKNSTYSGVVQRVNSNRSLLLSDVSDGNGCKTVRTRLFCGHEIVNVEFDFEATPDSGNHPQIFKPPQQYRKSLTLDVGEEEEVDLEIIDEFLQKFGPAVLHIKKQRVIGVCAEGVEMYKNGRLCWLLIATTSKVYFFDVLRLGRWVFKNGLSMILESQHILKVIHDCRSIAGCLGAQFGVKLTNVFDTQVADVLCFRSETGGFLPDRLGTLDELLHLRLKMPSSQLSSIQTKSKLSKKEQEVWYTRPCPAALMKPMVLSVVHLLPLRLELMDALMTDYLLVVDCYLNSSHYLPDQLEHASMDSMLELPREFKQLDRILSERHGFAAERFPVTEQGLLARFSAQSSPENSPAAEDQNGTQPESPVAETEEPPSSPRNDLLGNEPNPEGPGGTTVSSDGADEAPVAGGVSEQNATECSGISRSVSDSGKPDEVINITSVRNEESSAPAFPFLGRGSLLHVPPAQIPGRSAAGWRQAAPSALSQTKTAQPGQHDHLWW